MSTGKHYFIERTEEGKYAVRGMASDRASAVFDTQLEATLYVKALNPNDRPDVSRVRETARGGPDQWREA